MPPHDDRPVTLGSVALRSRRALPERRTRPSAAIARSTNSRMGCPIDWSPSVGRRRSWGLPMDAKSELRPLSTDDGDAHGRGVYRASPGPGPGAQFVPDVCPPWAIHNAPLARRTRPEGRSSSSWPSTSTARFITPHVDVAHAYSLVTDRRGQERAYGGGRVELGKSHRSSVDGEVRNPQRSRNVAEVFEEPQPPGISHSRRVSSADRPDARKSSTCPESSRVVMRA